jgi:branched-chain amino acid transport system permease protein
MAGTVRGYALLLVLIAAAWGVEKFAIPWVNPYYTGIAVLSGIYMVAAAGLSLVLGFTGQFSLGHAGFMAVGGYTAAFLSSAYAVPPPVALVAGAALAGVVGLLVGLPSLRLSGDYLAIVTLGFNGIIINVIENTDALGGATGIIGLPQWTTFGWTATCLLLAIFSLSNLLNSTHGRLFCAARDNEIALRSLGVDTTRVKVTAFVIGAVWAGVAGGLIAFLNASINPGYFAYDKSIEILAMVVLGGTGSLSGALLAGGVLTALPEVLRLATEGSGGGGLDLSKYRLSIYAFLLITMMILRPQGLLGTREVGDLLPAPLRRALGRRAA